MMSHPVRTFFGTRSIVCVRVPAELYPDPYPHVSIPGEEVAEGIYVHHANGAITQRWFRVLSAGDAPDPDGCIHRFGHARVELTVRAISSAGDAAAGSGDAEAERAFAAQYLALESWRERWERTGDVRRPPASPVIEGLRGPMNEAKATYATPVVVGGREMIELQMTVKVKMPARRRAFAAELGRALRVARGHGVPLRYRLMRA